MTKSGLALTRADFFIFTESHPGPAGPQISLNMPTNIVVPDIPKDLSTVYLSPICNSS
jgi:hypothetical protein